ncbi:MAG: major facilitator superfamily 1 [Phenylobacterium sp.]|nr:major facilitator superfamily 1 [Phenylobacterium sp.]
MSGARGVGRTGLIALASVSVPLSALSLPLVVMIPEHYANALGLQLALVGTIFTAVRLADIFIDPLLGAAMDGTRSRWGRYKPWLVVGAPLLMASVYLLFMAQRGVGPLYLLLGLVAVFLGWSVLSLAQLALAAGLSNGYNERSNIYAWLQAGFMCGTVAVMGFPLVAAKLHVTTEPTLLMGWVIIVLMAPAVAFAAWRTPEAPAPAERRLFGVSDYLRVVARPAVLRLAIIDLLFGLGFGVASAAIVFFFTAVKDLERSSIGLLLIAQMSTALFSMPLVTACARKLGKPAALGVFGLLAGVVSLAFLGLPKGNLLLACLAMMAWGVSYAAFTLLPRSMMADAGDELRLQSGADQTGVLFALLISSWKLGGALSVGAMFVALAAIGYQPALMQHNTPQALLGLQLFFAGPSAILFVVGAWLAFTYPLTRAKHQAIRAELEARGEDDAVSPAPGDLPLKGLQEA